jgi:hypothetical protein
MASKLRPAGQALAQEGVDVGIHEGCAGVEAVGARVARRGPAPGRMNRRWSPAGPAGQRGHAEAAGVAVAVQHRAAAQLAHPAAQTRRGCRAGPGRSRSCGPGHVQRQLPAVLGDGDLGGAVAAQPAGAARAGLPVRARWRRCARTGACSRWRPAAHRRSRRASARCRPSRTARSACRHSGRRSGRAGRRPRRAPGARRRWRCPGGRAGPWPAAAAALKKAASMRSASSKLQARTRI